MKFSAIVVACAATLSSASDIHYVMGVTSTNDAVHLFDSFSGALVQSNFIDLAAVGASTPQHALQVGNQIWVSDQIQDKIFRFDLNGSYMGEITGGLDNIKGMEVVGNSVWVTNAGTNNGAPGDSIVFIDAASYSITGSVATNGSLFDVINYNGQILASNITQENLELYDLSGNFAGTFHDSDGLTGIDFPEQLAARANGNVLAAGFSSPSGVYEYDQFGNDLGIVAGVDAGARGVIELGNGSVMWTNGAGFWVGGDLVFDGGSGRYLSMLTIPTPSGLAVLGVVGLVGVRRRR
tara:strand:- start:31675 stop:32556 length:882 start_codon:yes stop_codon:yes gene_type:complete